MKSLIRKEIKTVEQVVEVMEPLNGGDVVLYKENHWMATLRTDGFTRLTNLNGKELCELDSLHLKDYGKTMYILTREESITALAKMWGLPNPYAEGACIESVRYHLRVVGIASTKISDAAKIAAETITDLRKGIERDADTITALRAKVEQLKDALKEADGKNIALRKQIDIDMKSMTRGEETLTMAKSEITALRKQVEELQAEKAFTERYKDAIATAQQVLQSGVVRMPPAPPVPPAPAIRRFTLVRKEWLDEWQKSGKATKGQKLLREFNEYFITERGNVCFRNEDFELCESRCETPDFLALVDRGIYVEMTPGRVVYQKGESVWTTDSAGDCRWLNYQHVGHTRLTAKSSYPESGMIELGFTKIIG